VGRGLRWSNGWAIPLAARRGGTPTSRDAHDAEHLYRILEEEIVPLYYTRDEHDVPLGFVDRMRTPLRVAGNPVHRPPDDAGVYRAVLRSYATR
jgi:starch phosphorylase